MPPPQDSFQLERHRQAQSEGMKDDISRKQKPKQSGQSHIYIRQNRRQAKNGNMRQKGHYIMIQESMHQEDIKIVNTYASQHPSTEIN